MSGLLALLRKVFRRQRFHHRKQGPVTINPDAPETIHVWGNTKDTR